MRKREENTGLPYKLNADSVYMIFNVTSEKKGKDEKWREINITGLAGPLVSFGELRLSTITAQSLPRNPELGKRKPGPSFLSFFISSSISHDFSHPLHPIPLSSLFLFLIILFTCPLSHLFLVCPEGNFEAILIHLQAPKGPQHIAEGDYFSLFGGWNKLYCWCEW